MRTLGLSTQPTALTIFTGRNGFIQGRLTTGDVVVQDLTLASSGFLRSSHRFCFRPRCSGLFGGARVRKRWDLLGYRSFHVNSHPHP